MWLFQQWRQLWCRHEDVLRLAESRMWLECLACGRATHGFDGLGRTVRSVDVEPGRPHVQWRGRALDRAA